ncbi:MAG: hypothetical protein COB54_07695 [Alphaproteobacteria bacterium]|nr:MAG: hypothetical protein COB54_07695 [Alphaproteobacteria bacterium]
MSNAAAPDQKQVVYIETLARQLVRRFGRAHSLEICRNNQWGKVLDFIEQNHNQLNRPSSRKTGV